MQNPIRGFSISIGQLPGDRGNADMKLTLLTGHRTVGGTIVHFEQNGRGALIDFGLNYSMYSPLFDEFTKPRVSRGLADFWDIGLIPRINGIYRDITPPDCELKGADLPVEAVLLSHAHQDHVGNVPLLSTDIPLHMSALTSSILKSIQVTGKSDLTSELAAAVPRMPSRTDPRGMTAASTSTAAQAREVHVAGGGYSKALADLWNSPASKSDRTRQIDAATVKSSTGEICGVKYEMMPVDHSIPGCMGIIIHSEVGPIVYSSDLRFGGRQSQDSRKFVERLTQLRPTVLIIEGTRVDRRSKLNPTELDVRVTAEDIVRKNRGSLVIADYGGRHVERATSFLEIAKSTNRQLVLSSKDAHLLECISVADSNFGLVDDSNILVYDEVHCSLAGWERDLKLRHQGRLVDAREIHRDQGAFILAASYWDMPELLSVNPKKPVIIMSSSEAYSEDARIDLFRLQSWAHLLEGQLHGFSWIGEDDKGTPDYGDSMLNASGHLSEEELKQLLLDVKAEYVLPCHTSRPEWFEETLKGEPCKVMVAPADKRLTVCA
jgi:ribonuclease J